MPKYFNGSGNYVAYLSTKGATVVYGGSFFSGQYIEIRYKIVSTQGETFW